MKKEWVAGFLFTENYRKVALIRKARPEWQAGKLNGVGGKVEAGEFPAAAMAREWYEEAGLPEHEWREFCQLEWAQGTVHFFAAYTVTETDTFIKDTDEPVAWYYVADAIKYENTIPNLAWLLRLASDKDAVTAVVKEPSEGLAWSEQEPKADGREAALERVVNALDAWMLIGNNAAEIGVGVHRALAALRTGQGKGEQP